MTTAECTVVARPHPFCQRPSVVAITAGKTIQQILDEALDGADCPATLRVEVGGYEVPAKLWAKVRPKAGTQIALTVMPAGGDDGNKWLRTILMIVVVVVAWYAAPYVAGAIGVSASYTGVIASGLTMLGTMAVNALVPPPKPSLGADSAPTERQFALTGTQNRINPFGPIPLVVGDMRYYPTHAVLPYTEEIGAARYMRCMFDLGHGNLDVDDIRIGETSIDEFDNVQYEVTTTPTLYTDDVFEEQLAISLSDGGNGVRTTQTLTDEICVVIDFSGLIGMNKKGKPVAVDVSIDVAYRAVGDTTWITPSGIRANNWSGGKVRMSKRGPFPVSLEWDVPQGQYEVRVRRTTTDWKGSDPNVGLSDCAWSGLRSIRHTNPSVTGTTKLVVRIQATEQLQGTLQTVNCRVRQRVPVLVDDAWVVQPSTNPAWIVRWLLTSCPAISVHLGDAHIDDIAFSEFADFCDARELGASMVIDSGMSMADAVDTLLSAGMGARSLRDGKVSIVWDREDAEPVGVMTPANYKSFSSQRVFVDMPHGLKVKFTNSERDYITDEIVVIDDGYSYRGKDARGVASAAPEATRFEALDLVAARGAQDAWRVARHQMAQAKFRPVTHTMETDIEMLRYTRGDVLTVMDDVMDWGVASGRVKSITGSVVVTDNLAEIDGDSSLSMVIVSTQTGNRFVSACTSSAPDTFTLSETIPGTVAPGDVFYIGSTERQTRDLIVLGVQPSNDLTASIKLAASAPEIADYIDNPPDSILSEVTGLTYMDPPDPPRITVILSSQKASPTSDSGTTQPAAVVGIRSSAPGAYVRPSGSGRRSDDRGVRLQKE